MLKYFASQYRRLKVYLERRVENKIWDQRRAKALSMFTTEQRTWIEPALKNQETFQRNRFNVGLSTVYGSPVGSDQSATQKTARLNHDDLVYSVTAQMLKKIDAFRSVIGIQPMTGPVGPVFHMTAHYEPSEDEQAQKNIALKVDKVAVEATTRKFKNVKLNYAATASALDSQSGQVLVDEFVEAMGTEAAYEMARMIIDHLMVIGGKQNALDRAFKNDRIGDKVITALGTIGNKIGASGRRGPGNFVICGPDGLAKLQTSDKFKMTTLQTGHVLTHVGFINEQVKVYVSTVINDSSYIVGYNGNSSIDTGYVLAPYVPLMTTGPVADPQTYDVVATFATRYGVSLIPESPDRPVDSSSYYGVLRLKEAV